MTERRITENRGSRHTLIIRKVKPDDFGNYSCVADNAIGKSRQYLILSGKCTSGVLYIVRPELKLGVRLEADSYVRIYSRSKSFP